MHRVVRRSVGLGGPKEREATPSSLELQLNTQRRTVDFDTFDIHMQQLVCSSRWSSRNK